MAEDDLIRGSSDEQEELYQETQDTPVVEETQEFRQQKLSIERQLPTAPSPPVRSVTQSTPKKTGISKFSNTGKIIENPTPRFDVNAFAVTIPEDTRPVIIETENNTISSGPTGPTGSIGRRGPRGPQGRAGSQGPEGPCCTGSDLTVDETGLTLYGYTLGIDPNAFVAVAGISVGSITADILHVADQIKFANGMTAASVVTTVNGVSGDVTLIDLVGVATFNGAAGDVQGVSTFNGATGGITTGNLHLHVAGLSSDGGITVGGLISGGNGINLSSGNLEMVNGSRMGNATNGVFRVATNELQLLPNSDTTNAFFVASTLHKHNKITHFAEGISADDGSTFGAALQVDGNIHTDGGISADGGISGGHIHCASIVSDGVSTVGGVVLSSGVMVGTATAALSATSANTATSATNVAIQAVSDDTDYRVIFAEHGGGGTSTLNAKVDTGSGADGMIYNPSTDLLSLGGISSGAGCTFSDNVSMGASADIAGNLLVTGNLDVGTDTFLRKNVTHLGSSMSVPTDFDIDNANGETLIAIDTRNVRIGDCDSAGNGNNILVRDSHDVITLTSTTISTNADIVVLNAATVKLPDELQHNGDPDTKLSFPSANNLVLTAGGITFAHGTDAGLYAPAGLSADGGVTFGSINTGGGLQVDGNVHINGGISAGGGVTLNAGLHVTGGSTFGSAINFQDNQLERPKFKDYAETVNAIGTITGNTAIDFSAGNVQTVTGNGNCEFSFTNPPATGNAGTLTLLITNGGANTTTWASAVKWPGDVAPTLTTSGIDILSFVTIDAGSNIYGFVGGINFS